ncbi:MAG: DUF4230 domain-containing protein [Kurthia sp.]|nr:DUF4230 domain-containing protein [Candidatus Kurthia equi]
MRKKWIWITGTILLLAIIVGVIVNKINDQNHQTTGTVIEKINDLNELTTAEAFTKVIIERENNKLFGKEIGLDIPGTKQKILVIIPGTVRAGIDLSLVSAQDVQIDEDKKTINLTLPEPTIQGEPTLNLEKVKIFSSEGLFRDEATIKEGFSLAEEAQKAMVKEATEEGLLEKAKTNAGKSIAELFSLVDYQVNFTFKE